MRFGAQAEAFLKFARFVRDRDFPPLLTGVRETAFIILPWMQTAVPWFSLALALLYRARGLPVEIVFADTETPNSAESAGQIRIIEHVLPALEKWLPVTRLSAQSPVDLSAPDRAEIERLTELNTTGYLGRTGKISSEMVDGFRAVLTKNLGQLHPLFADERFDHWVVPGGIYGVSGLCLYGGRRYSRRVATYDSGQGSIALGVTGVAAECKDVAAMFQSAYADYLESHRTEAIALSQKEFELRRSARDRYGYSAHAYEATTGAERCDVLFPLNVFDDAAALGGFRFFTSAENWLQETIGFLLAHTDCYIVLREHPFARLMSWRDETVDKVMAAFPNESRLRFVASGEKVSTYRFLESAKVVLPYSSTVGVEAAILDKQVILENTAYYAGLGFVQQASSKEDYFARIGAALRAPKPLSEAQKETAWLCYFYGQVVGFVDSDFTPVPADFQKWVGRSFHRLAQERPVKLTVDALTTATPICRLQSELLFNPPPAEPPRKRFSLAFWK